MALNAANTKPNPRQALSARIFPYRMQQNIQQVVPQPRPCKNLRKTKQLSTVGATGASLYIFQSVAPLAPFPSLQRQDAQITRNSYLAGAWGLFPVAPRFQLSQNINLCDLLTTDNDNYGTIMSAACKTKTKDKPSTIAILSGIVRL